MSYVGFRRIIQRQRPQMARAARGTFAALMALLLAIDGSIKQLREVLDRGGLAPATVITIQAALASLAELSPQPDNAPQVLDAAANRLYAVLDGDNPPPGSFRNFQEERSQNNISWVPAGT